MKFQIRGAEGFNRVYVPFITPQVVNIETNTSTSAFPCELLCSIRAVHGEARELDGWVWNHSRHPGFCEANNAAVPCFSLVWDARPQFTEFFIQWLNVSQQNGWKRMSESTASQSDENASSFSASAAFPQLRDPDKRLWCGVCEQSTGIQKLKVRFALRDGGTNVQKRVSIVDSYTNNILHVKQQKN